MRPLIVASCVAAAALLSSCTRQGPPSPEFEQAQRQFTELYGRELEDAYRSPQLGPIQQKLESVPESSSDYERAQELLKRIHSGLERAEARELERQEEIAALTQTPTDVRFREEVQDAGPPTAATAAVDAGEPSSPVKGTSLTELTRRWGDCFLPSLAIEIPGKGILPTFGLRDTVYCRQQHPGYEQKILVMDAGRVFLVGDRKNVVEIRDGDAGVP